MRNDAKHPVLSILDFLLLLFEFDYFQTRLGLMVFDVGVFTNT